jgi:uncharacterized protein with HEPN domain
MDLRREPGAAPLPRGEPRRWHRPWAELIAIRNVYAHYTPRAINYERVWADTITDLDRITNAMAEQ